MRFVTNQLNVTQEQAEQFLLIPRDRIAIDIETVSLVNSLILGIAVAVTPETGYYFFDPKDTLLKQLVFQTPTCLFHNAAFDVPALEKLGFRINRWEDTMLLAYSNGFANKGLDDLSREFLHMPYTKVTEQWKKTDQGNIGIDHIKMAGWSLQHALNTYALWERLPKVDLYTEIDRPSIDLVMEMEKWGLLVDQYTLTQVEQEAVQKANQLEAEILQELGMQINLGSSVQVASVLQLKGIIGTRKTKSNRDSVSDESLRPLKLPLTNKILKWRSVMKTISTYVPAFRNVDYQGRIHTKFGYTNTGRWNSSKPNLQNMTRDDKFEGE